jgi:hypothetical protein
MKILPRRPPPAKQAAQQEDTTTEFETGDGPMAHRRVTMTVERETLSFLMRRPVAAPDAGLGAQPQDVEATPEQPDKNVPATPPARNELSRGKP